MANPIVPKNKKTPTGTARITGESNAKLHKAMKRIGQKVKIRFNKIPREVTSVEQAGIEVNAVSYRYGFNILTLQQLTADVNAIVDEELEGGDIITPFVTSSFNLGTATAIANLSKQAPNYPITVESMALSQPHQMRVSILQGRVFEEMNGLSGDMKANLNRILSTGMTQGDSPRVIAKRINEEIGIPEWNDKQNKASFARALRISRTEINHAHRVATRAQDQEANKLGIETKLLWFSALSATTRKTHARRHGHDYTRPEVESFYGRDGNEINCKCSQNSLVLVDGKPIDPDLLKRLQSQGVTFFEDK